MKKQLSKQSVNSPFGGFKGLLALLLFPLWGLGGFGSGLSAQVSVSNMAANYPAKQISFTVTWTTQPHNNQIWVITDYIKVAGTATTGSWSRATVTAVTKNSGTGTVATVAGRRGFWLSATGSSGSATVTATLSLAAGVDKFNWCAYALNTPPKAVLQAAGGYKLQGTPPFVVNGSTLDAGVKTFGAGTCIISLTDATDNPTFILPAAPTVSTSNPAARCGAGAVTLSATAGGGTTTTNTYTWVVDGGAAQTTSTGSLALASVAVGSRTYSVTVTNANKCTSAAATGTITAHGIPTITYASGSTNQTVNSGTAITAIKYNTSNATGASLTAQPTGVSGSWTSSVYTISGTPSNTGTFTFTAAATNTNGCTGTTASGTITVTQSCTNCASWSACTSVTSDKDSYNNKTYSGFTQISSVSYENNTTMNWSTANSYCAGKGSGWHLPTRFELQCVCNNKTSLSSLGGWEGGAYWSSSIHSGETPGYVQFGSCNHYGGSTSSLHYVKCVK